MRYLMLLLLVAGTAFAAGVAGLPAVVHKDSVKAYGAPNFDASVVATLDKGAAVSVAGQDGLWYELALDGGGAGYVRVNEIRVAHTGEAASTNGMQVLLTAKSGQGRVTETAGVRGLDQSQLRSAGFDADQLARMESYRVDAETAEDWAEDRGLDATRVAWASETVPRGTAASKESAEAGSVGRSIVRGLFGSLGDGLFGSAMDVAEAATPESEEVLLETELALGPQVAGRVLGARPLWDNPQAQRRVNLIGRWVASQSARPELPWTFGVIDSPELNAYAAPGGYVLVTRNLYAMTANDAELAAVLAHEINHIVQRDRFEVVRKQQTHGALQEAISNQVSTGGGLGASMARGLIEKHGAAMVMTKLDRDAEYRADSTAQAYLARAGMNPLALYSLLQKMAVVGTQIEGLAQVYATHPTMDDRLNRVDQRGYEKLQPYLDRNVARR